MQDPHRYGVLAFDQSGRAVAIEEKPAAPASSWAVTGLYTYDADAPSIARTLKPSARDELEITDLNRVYLERGDLQVVRLDQGDAWLDAGAFSSLNEASELVRAIQNRQRRRVGCPETIAFDLGYIDRARLRALADRMGEGEYAAHLREIAQEEETAAVRNSAGLASSGF